MKQRDATRETLGDFGYIRWVALAGLLLIGCLANALVIFWATAPAAAQAPPGATELVSDPDEIVERDDDGSFTSRPVFDRQVPLLHYGIRDADTGDWLSAVYQVRRGERRHRDGWEYTFEYPVLAEQPEIDPDKPYVIALITRQAIGAEVYTFHAVIPVYESDSLWDRVIGALSPDRWARAVARWIIGGVHGALCGVVERATGVDAAECR
ncbi:MAG: hypothetical protein OXC55_08955 [Chloroflexi bacterium]|nr:hypothetical protein [Chloroflexota bacterium]